MYLGQFKVSNHFLIITKAYTSILNVWQNLNFNFDMILEIMYKIII